MENIIFKNFNFNLLNDSDFKEDSVREEIILPILYKLGYLTENIVRSKSLQHPFIKIGSKKRAVNVVPDYVLKVHDNYAWVLDAKSPKEIITHGENVEQVFSYAIHPEIRTKFFALCNGKEFALFRQDTQNPILHFHISEINKHIEELQRLLNIEAFQLGKDFKFSSIIQSSNNEKFNYLAQPILDEVIAKKASSRRHFGVHGYFTKQSWNVVSEYIKNFSQPGDLVLDSFGGSGITAIEALMLGRKAIHIDLNPLSVFWVDAILQPLDFNEFIDCYLKIKTVLEKKLPSNDNEIKLALKKYWYPKGIKLPKGADVKNIEELFSDKQLAQLAFLRNEIQKVKNIHIKNALMLAFSSLITKINLTYHYSDSGGGDSGVFRYYRYRIAPDPAFEDVIKSYDIKVKNVLAAKKDIATRIDERVYKNAQIIKGTATNLSFIKKESVDYIYTDPPYGKKIPYLDLSVMWNGWLDLKVTDSDYNEEAIEGGEQNKSKENYNNLISKSIEEMYRVLKFDRWMSFVFAHKDPEFWHLIIETAEKAGFEYAGAVKQGNGQTSFKKRQNPFTVLAGQLIINFKKVKNPKTIMKANLGMDIADIVFQTIEGVIAKFNGATLEQINDELIIKGLELGFLDLLKKEYNDLTPILRSHFDYSDQTQLFTIKKNTKFKTHIDLNLRIRYYLISFLRRMELENKITTFDDIIFHIIPLLKNGITPENQTVLSVLENIGEHVGDDKWRLKRDGQQTLFD
jgi:16S rRNA G966 N2-methylase RsmD